MAPCWAAVVSALVLAMLTLDVAAATTNHWSYDNADEWSSNFTACGASAQSPVLVPAAEQLTRSAALASALQCDWPAAAVDGSVRNTGHTVQFDLAYSSNATCRGIPGREAAHKYHLAQVHMHWGSSSSQGGAEHSVTGSAPAVLEVHLVMFAARYANLTSAASKADGLSVLGILCDEAAAGSSDANAAIASLAAHAAAGAGANTPGNTTTTTLDLQALLRVHRSGAGMQGFQQAQRFFTYPGSLTTPPCYESVAWILAADRCRVAVDVLTQLREARDEDAHAIADNYRPVQALNGRAVSASFLLLEDGSAAGPRTPTIAEILIVAAAVLVLAVTFSLSTVRQSPEAKAKTAV